MSPTSCDARFPEDLPLPFSVGAWAVAAFTWAGWLTEAVMLLSKEEDTAMCTILATTNLIPMQS